MYKLIGSHKLQYTQAQEGVNTELERLDAAKDACLERVEATFQQIRALVDKRKQEMIENVEKACAEKRKVLEEQYSLIENEKNKVRQIYLLVIVNENCFF